MNKNDLKKTQNGKRKKNIYINAQNGKNNGKMLKRQNWRNMKKAEMSGKRQKKAFN